LRVHNANPATQCNQNLNRALDLTSQRLDEHHFYVKQLFALIQKQELDLGAMNDDMIIEVVNGRAFILSQLKHRVKELEQEILQLLTALLLIVE